MVDLGKSAGDNVVIQTLNTIETELTSSESHRNRAWDSNLVSNANPHGLPLAGVDFPIYRDFVAEGDAVTSEILVINSSCHNYLARVELMFCNDLSPNIAYPDVEAGSPYFKKCQIHGHAINARGWTKSSGSSPVEYSTSSQTSAPAWSVQDEEPNIDTPGMLVQYLDLKGNGTERTYNLLYTGVAPTAVPIFQLKKNGTTGKVYIVWYPDGSYVGAATSYPYALVGAIRLLGKTMGGSFQPLVAGRRYYMIELDALGAGIYQIPGAVPYVPGTLEVSTHATGGNLPTFITPDNITETDPTLGKITISAGANDVVRMSFDAYQVTDIS